MSRNTAPSRFKPGLIVALLALAVLLVTWMQFRNSSKAPHSDTIQAAAQSAPSIHWNDVSEEWTDWQEIYQVSALTEQDDMLQQGITLARERRAAMLELIQSDPQAALAAAIPRAEREQLPREIQEQLETIISARAPLDLIQSCFHPDEPDKCTHDHKPYRSTVLDGREYRVHVYGKRLNDLSIPHSSLHGIAIDGHLAVSESRVRVLDAAETQLAGVFLPTPEAIAVEANGEVTVLASTDALAEFEAAILEGEDNPTYIASDAGDGVSNLISRPVESHASGTKKMLVILVDFSDKPGPPIIGGTAITEDKVNLLINGTNGVRQFYQDSSFGKTDIILTPTVNGDSPDITQVLRAPRTASYYAITGGSGLLQSEVITVAANAGYATTTYDRICVLFSNLANFDGGTIFNGWAGNAAVGGKNSNYNGYWDFRTVAHELGHSWGLRHANLWQVTDGNPGSLSGTSTAYGNSYDTMGAAAGSHLKHFSPWAKTLLWWIPDTAVPAAQTSGTYRVHRFDHKDANLTLPRALKIVRDSTRDYWINYRRTNPADSLYNGAYVTWGYNINSEANLLDMNTPGTSITDAALNMNQTYVDSDGGITFTPIAQGGSGGDEWLDVQVVFQPRLGWASASVSVNEDARYAQLAVNRSMGFSGSVSINYATSPGTAIAPDDFKTSSGTLTWADGDIAPKFIHVPIVHDAATESGESFTVTLSSPSGAMLKGADTTTVSITNVPAAIATTVPNLVGSQQLPAEFSLASAQLTLGWVTLQYNTSVPAGQVLSQYPAAGLSVAQGSTVNVVVATNQLINNPPVAHAGADQVLVLGTSSPWTPSNIALEAWFDASDTTSITHSGNAVSQWADKSGNGRHVSQSTAAAKPTTNLVTLNTLNVLAFDGGDFLRATSFPIPASGDIAIFMVARMDAINSQSDSLFSLNATSTNFELQAFSSTSFTGQMLTFGVGTPVALSGGPFAGPSIYNCNFDKSGSGKYNTFIDGTKRAADTNYTTKLDPSQVLGIFANRTGTQFPLGKVAEVIVTSDLSTEARQKIEGYLAHKWGQQTKLPANHPHRTTPPVAGTVQTALNGTASDPDGPTPFIHWSQVSGPATVTFGSPNALNGNATFPAAGTYVLRLTASDGISQVSHDIVVTVFPNGATYTITYNGNGNTGGTAPANQTKAENIGLVLSGPGNLTRSGYDFVGWNTAANGNGTDYPTNSTYTGNAALNLYAKWDTTGNGTWLPTLAGPFNWSDSANWANGTIATGVGYSASFTPNLTANQTVNLNANITIGNITFTDSTTSSHDLAISGTNTLTLSVASGSPVIDVTQAERTLSIATPIAGTHGLRKNGTGILTLSGASNNYTGVTTVNAGILSVASLANGGSASSIGASTNASTNLVLEPGTTLRYTGAGGSTNRSFTINGSSAGHAATLDASGSGAIQFTGTTPPVLGTTNQTRTLTLTGTNTAGNTLAANLANNGTGQLTVNKIGAGTWVLTGTNTNQTTDYNTSSFTNSGGGLLILRGAAAIQNAGVLKATGTATYRVESDTSFSTATSGLQSYGTFNFQADRQTPGNGDGLTFTFANPNGLSSELDGNTTLNFSAGPNITSGTPTVNISSTGGAFRTRSPSDNTTPTINANGVNVRFNGYYEARSTALRTLVLGGTSTGSEVYGAINNPSSGVYTLIKNGTGTWTFSANNNYTGTTTVNAGKLVINGNQSTASGNVSVAADATLGGTGTIGGNTTIDANGGLAFHLSTLAASHDKLELATGKSLTFSGASVLTITGTPDAKPGDYILLTAPGGINGNAPAPINLPADWAATVSIVNNNLVLHLTSAGPVVIRTVTFDANGGTSPNPATMNVTVGSPYGTLATTSRTGYTFNGWFTADTGGTEVTASTTVAIIDDQTLYARWTPNTYTVTFQANGGGTPTPASTSVTYDEFYGNLATVSRTGHTFNGWFTAASGGSEVSSFTTVSITANQTLYAQWTPNTYNITFDSNGGEAPAPATTKDVTYGSTYGTLSTTSRTGHTFNGWFTAPTGGTQVTDAATVAITADQTLYAQWTPDTYLVTYSGNGSESGSAPANQDKLHDIDLTLRTNTGSLVKTGFSLVSWNTAADGTGTDFPVGGTYTVNAALTLYAKWSAVADGTWLQTLAGPFNWGDPANWTNGTIASGAGYTASFTPNFTENQTVNLEEARTIGNITFTDATTASHDLTISGTNALTLANTAVTPVINVTQTNRTLTIATPITGTHGLSKSGTGALTLSGDNSGRSGTTTLSAGTLNLNSPTALGTGAFTISGGTINNTSGAPLTLTTNNAITTNNLTFGGSNNLNLGASGVLISFGDGTVTLNGTNSTLTIDGLVNLDRSSFQTLTVNGAGNTLVVGRLRLRNSTTGYTRTINTSANIIVTGPVLNSEVSVASFVKSGAGTLTLNGSTSSYVSTTNIQAGTLIAGANAPSGSAGAFGNSTSALVLGNTSTTATNAPTLLIGGAFTVARNISVGSGTNANAYNATIGGSNTSGTATYSGAITLNTTATAYTTTLRAATGGTVDFTGTWTTNDKPIAIGSSGNTGTVRLSSNLTTAGGLSVNHGTLLVGGAATVTSNISVAANAALGGTGVINGNATIDANGGLAFHLSTTFTNHDKLELTTGKSLTLSGASTLTITGTPDAAPGDYVLLTAPGGISGVAPALNLPTDWVATVTIIGNDLVLKLTGTTAYDTWAAANGLTGETNTAPEQDRDGDGLINLQEFAFGMNPTSSARSPLSYTPNGTTVGSTGGGTPVLENTGTSSAPNYRAVFVRRKDHLAAGLIYEVQFSANLTHWEPSLTAPEPLTGVNADPLETVTVPFPDAVPLVQGGQSTATPKFFRVGVSMP